MDPSAAFEAEEAIHSPKLNNQNEGSSETLEATSSSIPTRSISKSNSTSSSRSRSPNAFPLSPIHTDPPSFNLDSNRDREATFAPSHRSDQPQPWTQPEHSVVRNRQGSVLTRGLVLKTDHFAGSARPAHLSLHLQGAPNFRKANCPLEVYGVAQPTITGLKTILCVLKCQPGGGGGGQSNPNSSNTSPSNKCVWVCTREEPVIYVGGRPFVLREANLPTQTFGLSGRANNLESIEQRLKSDILKESKKFGGMLLVHEEIPLNSDSSSSSFDFGGSLNNGKDQSSTSNRTYDSEFENLKSKVKLIPTWVSVDSSSIQTVREVFTQLILLGWSLSYHRIPIAPSSLPENSYLDAYTQLIREIDINKTSFVANCGVGFTRTTFAMVAACIVRRKQAMLSGMEDPFGLEDNPLLSNQVGEEVGGNGNEINRSKTPTLPSTNLSPRNSVSLPSSKPGSGHSTPASHNSSSQSHNIQTSTPNPVSKSSSTNNTNTNTPRVLKSLQKKSELTSHNQSLLRLISIISIALNPSLDPTNTYSSSASSSSSSTSSSSHNSTLSATNLLLSRPDLLDSLMSANAGDYGLVKQLCSLLDDGILSKKIVDYAIDACSQVTNLREAILLERIRAGRRSSSTSTSNSTSTSQESNSNLTNNSQLTRATSSLEKYIFLIAFESYVSASKTAVFQYRFASWLRIRGEIWSNILRLRKKGWNSPWLFEPVGDLSVLVNPQNQEGMNNHGLITSGNQNSINGNGINDGNTGDEFAEHLVRNRGGIVLRNMMLLKCDIWKQFIEQNQGGGRFDQEDDEEERNDQDSNDQGDRTIESSKAQDEEDAEDDRTKSNVGNSGLGLEKGSKIRGTINFRRVPKSNIFATGQPTTEGIRNVLRTVREIYISQMKRSETSSKNSELSTSISSSVNLSSFRKLSVTWLNLREEPVVYINGKPYCLRQRNMSLRNLKEFSGISWTRLNLLEERLKNDILNEIENGEGRILLHNENDFGEVFPVWEEVRGENVETIQEVMVRIGKELQREIEEEKTFNKSESDGTKDDQVDEFEPSIELIYRRIPITAEKPPDFKDIEELLQEVLKADIERSPIILNCQLGRGRSTLTSIIVLLIERWLRSHGRGRDLRISFDDSSNRDDSSSSNPINTTSSSTTKSQSFSNLSRSKSSSRQNEKEKARKSNSETLSYHVINSLLRVIPKGLEVKRIVDLSIDQCSNVFNLRESIEESRLEAENSNDDLLKRKKIQNGIHNLRRYFELLVFQSYLSNTEPDTIENQITFETFVKKQPVFDTISKEFDKVDEMTIRPLQKVDPADGMALDDEVQEVVQNRKGSILSAYTMLKSDFFSGIVKMSLPDKIPGIPNLRGVSLLLGSNLVSNSNSNHRNSGLSTINRAETWGSGMPTVDGLRKGLERIGVVPNGNLSVVWTSLREEPVLYVNGRPHVLRLADQPLTNVEATGVTTDVVERMEVALKADVLAEAKSRQGRVLLHDEVEVKPGNFDIIPVWETVQDGDVLTPREVYEMIVREGYKVDYARVAVTDEQAPVPAVFSQLEERVSLALRSGSTAVFNCQMGRGRTTTGMVIASLVSTVRRYSEELFNSDMSASFVSRMSDDDSGLLGNEDTFDNAKDGLDNREDDLWLQGEYRSILQLVGVLSQGKLAKKLTDKAIDRMEAVQNLRRAIYDSKLRASNADPGSAKARHLTTVFTNYLQRYGYLIAFANYLLEKSAAALENEAEDDDDGRSGVSTSLSLSSANVGAGIQQQGGNGENEKKFPSFLTWLKPRREITNLLTTRKLV